MEAAGAPTEFATHDLSTFGGRLRFAREDRGMTQVELAAAVGVSARAVRFWEANEKLPDLERLGAISVALSVAAAWLLEGPVLEDSDREQVIGLVWNALRPVEPLPPLWRHLDPSIRAAFRGRLAAAFTEALA